MNYTRETFAEALISALGYPLTKLSVQDVMSWEQAEGGAWNGGAKYNPLNTTEPMTGATDFNSVGVKNYTSWDQGLAATVKTLTNGHYTDILNDLAIGGTQDFGVDVGNSPWGTETFTVTGQPIKNLTDPSNNLAPGPSLTDTTPPTLSDYPGLFVNSDGVYQVKYSASIGADIANLYGQSSSISAIKMFNDTSKSQAAALGTGDKYIEWVNANLSAVYGPKGAMSAAGGSEGAMSGLSLSALIKDLMKDLMNDLMKDPYIFIGVILVGVLVVVIVAKNIRPMTQKIEAVAPLAAAAV